MMQSRLISATIGLAIILAVTFVLLFAYSLPAGSDGATTPISFDQDAAEPAKAPTEASGIDATATGPAAIIVASTPDGSSLLERHCTKCHTAQSLIQIKKERPEWEMTLAQMERMGVRLSDSEKLTLLDYLADTGNKP